MSEHETYDYLVIGGGSAGLTGAIMAARLGAKVLLVDRERLGGDCLNTGCVPSKALIASAKSAHHARHAADFGVGVSNVEVNFPKVMQRVQAIQAEIGATEDEAALAKHEIDVAFGGARFTDANQAQIGSERVVHFRFALIATGSRPSPPPVAGMDEVDALNTDSLWELSALPRSLAILGGGPIGVEMGQAFQRLGSQVTIFERGERLLGRADSDASAMVLDSLRDDGVEVRLNASVGKLERDGEGTRVFVDGEGHTFDKLLVAVGRKANVEELGLEAAGVLTHARGVQVGEDLRTSQKHIYAAGDCTGGPQFTHWAEYEARIATRNALFVGSDKRSLAIVPAVTFCDPEVAQVGLTEAQAKEKGLDVHVHRVDYSHVDRALCDGTARGFAKVVVDDKERILGAHLVGPLAGEALGEWVLAMEHGLKLSEVGGAIHAYPTYARVNRRVDDERFFAHGVSKWTTKLFSRF
ncbi:MAG: pyruvate/2-oxoglutarate dehydrogenase complex dihydrolipoamide dehydrogenase (E3) component [Polyangiales bacterium]|jgi:pyruvate/2-oxoglutarate dehydrogenase complex dihydrolipoamide dehydrogenase (E3) component